MSTPSNNELLSTLDNSGVLTLSMNRPQVHNAFDEHQILRLTQALEQAAADDAVKVVVLSGEGKHFSAGGDINYMRRMGHHSKAENIADARLLAKLMNILNFLPKPTVASVQGAAFGGGFGLVSCVDMAIGSTRASFSLSEVKLGLAPATIGPYVVRAIGQRAARRLFVSGERIGAAEALKIGLLHHVVEEDELQATVHNMSSAFLLNSPSAMRAAKAMVVEFAAGDITGDMIEYSIETIAQLRESPDGREGTTAFLEKRKPQWS